MSIGAGGILRAAVLGLVLGAVPVAAQAPAGGTWTDPPARAAAPTPPVSTPATTTNDITRSDTKNDAATSADKEATPTKPATVAPKPVRHAATRARPRVREVRRVRQRVVAEAVLVRPRLAERREARPVRRAVVRSFTPRYVEARRYATTPMPVGLVEGSGYGERSPIFDDGQDRTQRIAAAHAAGYLVLRSRSVQFPDGRTLRTYRPYAVEDDLD